MKYLMKIQLKVLLIILFFIKVHATGIVDFDELSQEINKQSHLVHISKGKDVVIFLGNTGSGKSTLINYLADKKLRVEDEDIVLSNPKHSSAMPIGVGGESETIYPKSILLENLLIFDMPGFQDTKGSIKDLTNTIFIKQILTEANTIKIVFVMSQPEIVAGHGKFLKDLLDMTKNLFAGYSEQIVADSSLLVMTKSTHDSLEGSKTFLLHKCSSQYHAQLKVWTDKKKFFRMCCPTETKEISFRERPFILQGLRTLLPGQIYGQVNISAIYPYDAQITIGKSINHVLSSMFSSQKYLGQDLSKATLTQLQLLKKQYSDVLFWEEFEKGTLQLPGISLLKSFDEKSYSKVWQRFTQEKTAALRVFIETLATKELECSRALKSRYDERMKKNSLDYWQKYLTRIENFVIGQGLEKAKVCLRELEAIRDPDSLMLKQNIDEVRQLRSLVNCQSSQTFLVIHSRKYLDENFASQVLK